ncbi:putative mitochondrial chaperone BCS1-A [Gracilariopsis chorda]|uniref:Putative mitochondrial chaperone BCS1-A n=1 Tax=Gracilariopsis chorda TaxID=448386 RepID=A0A2V3ISB8_9FLOR|nr:putative mitochondrial chaperone BCS1-A [Gracilariopsis chorda]|eukprot:PXF45016.1 putative mitochondrial chaperone BCS1-A [Gracilariopsis chorda]
MASDLSPLSFSSVPQAALTHFPDSHAKHLIQVFDVPADRISSCTIMHDNEKLFNAILLYAALCPNPAKPNLARRFYINSSDPYVKGDDDKDVSPTRSHRSKHLHSRSIAPGKGERRAAAPVPKLKMDIGTTVVYWPPPEHLVPKFLTLNDNHEPYKLPDGMEDSINVHIMHYEVGTPQKSILQNDMSSLHVARVSTHHGDEALQVFLQGILQWSVDRSNPDHNGRKYNLYRFKVDSCGVGSWEEQGSRRGRPHESVLLREGQMGAILEDIEQFLHPDAKDWYIQHGLPHRRSFLFEGSPGTGKTSTIRVIAGQYSLSCCFLSMTNEKFSNQLLCDALSELPSNALLVLEDVDALFNADRTSASSSSLTFSGLLNVLDGVTSVEGLITIMTTNHANRLDPALIRGGRIDRRFCFTAPSEKELAALFRMFYEDAPEELVNQFVTEVAEWKKNGHEATVATLQQFFISFRGRSAEKCVEGLQVFLSEQPAATSAGETDSQTQK